MAIDSGSPLQISINGSTRLTIPTTGRLSMPNQPAFSAYNSATNNQTTVKDTWGSFRNNLTNYWSATPIPAHVNVGSNFNQSTGVFTAPVAGNYLLSCHMGCDIRNTWYIQLYKNGTLVNPYALSYEAEGYLYNYNSYDHLNLLYILSLAANDTFTMATLFSSATYATYAFAGYAGVAGFLIG
jgi:hypothetical protein